MDMNFFLATHSAQGFVNLFEQSLTASRRLLLKGSAGSGKSGTMRAIARHFASDDLVLVPCASDPDSLDVVWDRSRDFAVVDATPPHVLAPRNPVCDQVANYYAHIRPQPLLNKLAALNDIEKTLNDAHADAAAHLSVAGTALLRAQRTQTLNEKAVARTVRQLVDRLLDTTRAPYENQTMLLSAFTPKGRLCLTQTLAQTCDHVFVLQDESRLAAWRVLSLLVQALTVEEIGYIRCPDPLFADRTEGLLFPQCGLAILIEPPQSITTPCTLLHCDLHATPVTNRDLMSLCETHQRAACLSLARAKTVHDELEKIYNPAMDWKAVDAHIARLIESLESA